MAPPYGQKFKEPEQGQDNGASLWTEVQGARTRTRQWRLSVVELTPP